MENTSPVPKQEFPKCHCGQDLEEIQYMDYGNIRVVMHTGPKCVVGVLNI
jgi:hypothetical protein